MSSFFASALARLRTIYACISASANASSSSAGLMVESSKALRTPGAPTDEDDGILLVGGTFNLECSDLDGLIGDVAREPLSLSLGVSFEFRRATGRTSLDALFAFDEIVPAAAAGGMGRVRLEGGILGPRVSAGRGGFFASLVADIGASSFARCDPEVGCRGALTVPNSEIRLISAMLDALDRVLDCIPIPLRLPGRGRLGGGMLGDPAGRLAMRGILVGVAEGVKFSLNDEVEASCRRAGD